MDGLKGLQDAIGKRGQRFPERLMHVLVYVDKHDSKEVTDVVGLSWVTDTVFRVRTVELAEFLNLRPNSLNCNLRACQIVKAAGTKHPKGIRDMCHIEGIIKRGCDVSIYKLINFDPNLRKRGVPREKRDTFLRVQNDIDWSIARRWGMDAKQQTAVLSAVKDWRRQGRFFENMDRAIEVSKYNDTVIITLDNGHFCCVERGHCRPVSFDVTTGKLDYVPEDSEDQDLFLYLDEEECTEYPRL